MHPWRIRKTLIAAISVQSYLILLTSASGDLQIWSANFVIEDDIGDEMDLC
jgi:hypothetical protein